jgi:hypothetical protein
MPPEIKTVYSDLVPSNDRAYLHNDFRRAVVNSSCENLAFIQLHDLNISSEKHSMAMPINSSSKIAPDHLGVIEGGAASGALPQFLFGKGPIVSRSSPPSTILE